MTKNQKGIIAPYFFPGFKTRLSIMSFAILTVKTLGSIFGANTSSISVGSNPVENIFLKNS
jgi:hypothetical protein